MSINHPLGVLVQDHHNCCLGSQLLLEISPFGAFPARVKPTCDRWLDLDQDRNQASGGFGTPRINQLFFGGYSYRHLEWFGSWDRFISSRNNGLRELDLAERRNAQLLSSVEPLRWDPKGMRLFLRTVIAGHCSVLPG